MMKVILKHYLGTISIILMVSMGYFLNISPVDEVRAQDVVSNPMLEVNWGLIDNLIAVATWDQGVEILDLVSGDVIELSFESTGFVFNLAFHPSSGQIATVGANRNYSAIAVSSLGYDPI
ncbi:MAG: hypothetical protein SGI73_23095 [Chloroflexota bacterium]|nr:hypothetical protein [Chloroflexota bacterium]